MTDKTPPRRPLFRKQAVDSFVGVFGDGMTPDLIAPGRRRLLRKAQVVVCLLAILWGVAAFGGFA